MSNRIIDEQVVKMEFDNSKFEKNAEASLRTIEKVKEALKFENADKGFSKLENAANTINLNKLENNIQSIANRFSTMGIIGDQVLRNLTNSVMGAVHKLGGLLAAPINQMISGGKARAMNIANAQFSLKGQGIDWKKESEEFVVSLNHMTQEEQDALEQSGKFVDSLYKDIDYAVSGTAYGLDSAAKAAAQLSASGVQIGDDMRIALRGISGVAAMTNTSYDDIARIFMHVAGKNKVQLEELNMISERGLGVSAKLAEYIGVSEAEISDMVSKGKIDFATFAACMDDAFGEHAKDANNTFTGALSNMKAALSRIGADVAGPVYDAMIKPLNDIRSVINNIRAALQPLFKDVEYSVNQLSKAFSFLLSKTGLVTPKTLGIDQMPRLAKTIENLKFAFLNLALALSRVIKPFRLAFMDVFQPSADVFVNISEAIRNFTEKLLINSKTQKTLYNVFTSIFKIVKSLIKIIGNVARIIIQITDALSPLIEFAVMIVDVIVNVIASITEWIAHSDLLNAAIQGLSTVIPILIQFIINLTTGIVMLIAIVVNGVAAFINWISQFELLNSAAKLFGDVLTFLIEVGQKAVDAFKSFFELLFGNKDSTKDLTNNAEEMSGVLGERLVPSLEDAGDKAQKTKSIFEEVAQFISNCIKVIGDAIDKFYEGSRPVAASWLNIIKGFNINAVADAIQSFIAYISKIDLSFEGICKAISDGYNKLLQYMGIKDGGIDWDRIWKIFKAVGMYKVVSDLLGLAKKTATVASQFSKQFTIIANAIQENLAAEAFYKRIAAFRKICEGILMIAAALFIVGAIREDRLWPAVAAIGVLVVVGAALMEAIKYLDKRLLPATDGGVGVIDKIILNLKKIAAALAMSFTITGIGASILMISAAIWLLAGAFITWNQILSDPNIKTEETLKMFGILAAAIAAFVVIAGVISWKAPATGWTLLGVAAAIIAIVVGLYAVFAAIVIFNQIPWEKYQNGLEQVRNALIMIAAAALVIGIAAGKGLLGAGVALLGIAAALASFVYATQELNKIPWYTIVGSLFVVGVFLFELAAALEYIGSTASGLGSNVGFMKLLGLSFTIMAIAYSVSECVNVMKKLHDMDPIKAFVSFVEVCITMYLLGTTLSKIGHAMPNAWPILAMAILIGAIAMAFTWIATYEWNDILKSIFLLGVVLAACALCLKLSHGNNERDWLRILSTAAIILAVGISLSLLATQPWHKILVSGGIMAAVIGIISAILSKVSVQTGRPLTILAFAAAIVAIAGSLALLANFDPGRVIASAIGMAIAIIALGGILVAISKYGSQNIGIKDNIALLATIVILMGILAGIIAILANVTDTDDALKAAGAITLLMAAVIGMYVAIGKVNVTPTGFNKGMLIAIAGLVAECAIIVGLLSAFAPPDDYIFQKIVAIIALLAAIAGLYAEMAVLQVTPTGFNKGMLIAIAGLVAECAIIVGLLSNFANPDHLIEKIAALDLLIAGVAGIYAAIALLPVGGPQQMESKVAILIACIVIVGVLALLEAALGQIPLDQTERAREAAILLAQMCVGLAGLIFVVGVLAAIAGIVAPVLKAGAKPLLLITAGILILVFAFIEIIEILGLIEAAIDEQGGPDGIKEITDKGAAAASAITSGLGEMIGSFVGGLAGGFYKSSSEGFGEYCDTIIEMIEKMQPVLDMISSFDDEGVTSINTVVAAMQNLFSAFSTLQFNDIDDENTAAKIKTITDGLNAFASAINDQNYDIEKAQSALDVSNAIKDIYDAFTKVQSFNVDESLSTAITNLATMLVDYDDILNGHTFDIEATKSAISIITELAGLADVLGNFVNIDEELARFSDIPTFGQNLVDFADCIVKYNEKVSSVEWDTATMDKVIEVAKKLVDISNSLNPLYDGFTQYDDLKGFGEKLKSFATSLYAAMYIFNAGEWNSEKIDGAIGVAERLQTLAERLGGDKGLVGLIEGNQDKLDDFGKDIEALGSYLSAFNTTASELNFDNVDSVLSALDKFLDSFTKISSSNYDNEIVRNLIGTLPSLGTNIGSYANNVAEFDFQSVNKSIICAQKIISLLNQISSGTYSSEAVDGFVTGLETLGKASFDKFIAAFNSPDIPAKIKNAIDSIFSYLRTMDNSFNLDRMYVIGKNYVEKLIDGMKSEESFEKIRTGMTIIVTEIKKAFQNGSEEDENNILTQTGIDMLKNISEGFSDTNARTDMAQKLSEAIKWAFAQSILDIEEAGAFKTAAKLIISGIAGKITASENVSAVADAIQAVVDSAVQGISVNVDIPVNVAAGEVLGERLPPRIETVTAKYCAAVSSATEQITTSQNQAASTISTNDAKQSAKARKEYSKQRQEERKTIREESAKTQTEIKEDSKKTGIPILDAFNDGVQTIEKGFGDLGNAFENGGNDLASTLSAGAEKIMGDSGGTVDEILDNLTGYKEQIEEKTTEFTDDMENQLGDVGTRMSDAMGNVGKGAASGAKSGGDAFVASYSEFWQNLYLVNHQGIKAFEGQFETFEQWQENTLKKTQEIIDNYKNAVVDAKKKAAEGLFSEVAEPKEDVTKEKLKKNLQDQVNQIKEFNNIILQLRTRLMGTNLFDAITEMGVDSIDELRALNSMTNEELSEYASLYDQKYVASFQTIQQKAQSELQNLYGGMAININQFATTFNGSLQSVEGYFAAQAETIKAAAVPVGSYFTQGVAQGMNDPEAQAEIQTGVSNALVEGETSAVEQALTAIDAHSPAQDERVQSIGSYFTQGLAEGMTNEEALQSITDATELLMQHIIEAFNMANENQEGGSAFMEFGNRFSEALTNALTNFEVVATEFRGKGEELMGRFLEGFNARAVLAPTDINATMTQIANYIKAELNTLKFKSAGTELFKALMKGFQQGWTGAGENGQEGEKSYGKTVLEKIMKSMFKTLKEYKGGAGKKSKGYTFYKLGIDFIKGLIAGLQAHANFLYKAIEQIIQTALARAQAAADAHSPSRETMKIGEWMGQGFVIGLNSLAGAVYEASTSITEEALQGFRDISQVLGGLEDFDASPVIAPVMDLTGIQNGVSEMGNLLDRNSSYEMAASINSGLEAQRAAKLNEMTNLRRAMDSVYNSNSARTTEMANLQAAVANLNSSINNQTAPDYTNLQSAINGLNKSMSSVQTGTTYNMNPIFNISSNDPEAVAEEVNTALQKMIDRRSAVWA